MFSPVSGQPPLFGKINLTRPTTGADYDTLSIVFDGKPFFDTSVYEGKEHPLDRIIAHSRFYRDSKEALNVLGILTSPDYGQALQKNRLPDIKRILLENVRFQAVLVLVRDFLETGLRARQRHHIFTSTDADQIRKALQPERLERVSPSDMQVSKTQQGFPVIKFFLENTAPGAEETIGRAELARVLTPAGH